MSCCASVNQFGWMAGCRREGGLIPGVIGQNIEAAGCGVCKLIGDSFMEKSDFEDRQLIYWNWTFLFKNANHGFLSRREKFLRLLGLEFLQIISSPAQVFYFCILIGDQQTITHPFVSKKISNKLPIA